MEPNIFVPGLGTKVVLWKHRRKRQKILLKDLLSDYAQNTTLHGLRYTSQKGLSIVERIFWLLTFLLSVTLCFLLIHNVWLKWKTSPVIVSFSEKFVPIEMVPFPSVTICPDVKNRASVYNLSEEMSKYNMSYIIDYMMNMTSSEIKASMEKAQDVSAICPLQRMLSSMLFMNRGMGNASIVRNILEVSPSPTEYAFNCVWRGEKLTGCNELFTTVLTEQGVCFNFNSLAANEIFRMDSIQRDYNYSDASYPSKGWGLEGGYLKDVKPYPRRGMDYGNVYDLEVILQVPKNDPDNSCNGGQKGFKIYVLHPSDHPQASPYFYAALPGQASSVALKFNMISTSDSLKKYNPLVRQCYFQSERYLRYFKIYTAKNCKLECQANYTFEKCGCVWFHMPHNDSNSICTADKFDCIVEAREQHASKTIEEFVEGEPDPCSCLPTCDSIDYDAEMLKTDFNFSSILKHLETSIGFNTSELVEKYDYSTIVIHFKESRFVSMRRSELFGLTDFLANCGGLLGLFLGFSFLSLVEIVYFMTLRFGFILKKDFDQEKITLKKDKVIDIEGVTVAE